jgi:hypothetical protein
MTDERNSQKEEKDFISVHFFEVRFHASLEMHLTMKRLQQQLAFLVLCLILS